MTSQACGRLTGIASNPLTLAPFHSGCKTQHSKKQSYFIGARPALTGHARRTDYSDRRWVFVRDVRQDTCRSHGRGRE